MVLNTGMTTTQPRTLPRNFVATLADRHMDQITTGYAIAYERACAATSERARTRWQNVMKAISDHVIFERGFRIFRVDPIAPFVFEKLGVG